MFGFCLRTYIWSRNLIYTVIYGICLAFVYVLVCIWSRNLIYTVTSTPTVTGSVFMRIFDSQTFTYPSFYLYIFLLLFLPVCLSVYLYVYMHYIVSCYGYLHYISICISLCQYKSCKIYISLDLSVYLSISWTVYFQP